MTRHPRVDQDQARLQSHLHGSARAREKPAPQPTEGDRAFWVRKLGGLEKARALSRLIWPPPS
jgi:hypothetical protein